ncbi:glycosyltransferase family 32 protein [Pyxidicoccus xibeiensis]|uniref:hypothetical protein n=1 Tax=Pyxidicoccus xibeiensis TaxID=2906759 RepID=UPI0020A7AE1B|nr:hypothetical protein [Pyxidicoccus xibeiensis]MCP3137347.1 hypothetical protein [Pyxidicoccus xibeiensis]
MTTPALSFCFQDTHVRPTVVAAIRSAMAHNRGAAVHVYCDTASITRYQPLLPKARFEDLSQSFAALQTTRLDVAARRMRALALHRHGGWYLDAFDTLTLRPLPEVERFTIGEECWDARRRCTGACASPPGDPFALAWLTAMKAVPDAQWDHWSDQTLCNRVIDSGRFAVDRLPTGRLNWPSESGFTGELRLSEDQIEWLLDNAWVIHYFGRGARGLAYKEMDLTNLRRCRNLDGWLPRLILHYSKGLPTTPSGPSA